MSIEKCRLIDLPKVSDFRGNLSFIEGGRHVPFDIKRMFYIYDVPTGTERGAHAHRELQQFIICLGGSFDVQLDDGRGQKTVSLARPWQGLYIPPMVWAAELNFSTGAVYVVLASDFYDEADYFRDYASFLAAVNGQ
jgi:dTDP-4-dehydrorhamnose 3,5-epimerase-like enzyme